MIHSMIAGRALVAPPAPLSGPSPDMTDALPNGETALWRAVVLQAFQDATLGLHGASARRKLRRPSAERRAHVGTARSWLLGNGADLRRVCALAGLDPEAVRLSASVAIANADTTLAELQGQAVQPHSQEPAIGERFFSRILVGERDINGAKPLKDGSFPGNNQYGKDGPLASSV